MRISDWSSDVCSSDLTCRVHPGIGGLRTVEGLADAAGVPRAAGAVGWRGPDRGARADPRRAARRRREAADEPGVDDLWRGAGDRADHRRLDPGLGPLVGDRKRVGWGRSGSVSVGYG